MENKKLTPEQFLKTLKIALEMQQGKEDTADEFPSDYQDTYELGIKHGKIRTAKFFLYMLAKHTDIPV